MAIDPNQLCMGCMTNKGDANECPHCGWVEGRMPELPQHLPPGTILRDKYLLGRVLGYGGFGVTYLAWDLDLNLKVAVKEYLPQNISSRNPGTTQVQSYSGDMGEQFHYGLEKFLEEARTVAQFEGHQNIVNIRDFFRANSTAYYVMPYLEGITLKQYLAKKGSPLTYDLALNLFMPVLDSLAVVHQVGILHRDISPDNIFITNQNVVKVLDFGAARQVVGGQNSLSVILKPGYAPEEQYRTKGNQGPWTDVYACAAMFYRMITGQIPPESLDRLENDTLVPPSRLCVEIPPEAEIALLQALSVKAVKRFQSVAAFKNALVGSIGSDSSSAAPATPGFVSTVVSAAPMIQPPSTQAFSNPIPPQQVSIQPPQISVQVPQPVSVPPVQAYTQRTDNMAASPSPFTSFSVQPGAPMGSQSAQPLSQAVQYSVQPPQPMQYPLQPTAASQYVQPIAPGSYTQLIQTSPYMQSGATAPAIQSKGHKALVLWLAIGIPVLALIICVVLVAAGFIAELKHPNPVAVVPQKSATRIMTQTQSMPILKNTPIPATTLESIPTEKPSEPVYLLPDITVDQVVAYFSDISLKSNNVAYDGLVKRWEQPITVAIHGNYTQEDYDTLITHMDILNEFDGMPDITVVEGSALMNVYFTTMADLVNVIPDYQKDNWGYYSLYWNDSCQITNAYVGIATDVTTQAQRNHMILEHFTHALGLLNFSAQYPDSIFYSEWTETPKLSELDYWIIAMLYSPEIKAGMHQDEVIAKLISQFSS